MKTTEIAVSGCSNARRDRAHHGRGLALGKRAIAFWWWIVVFVAVAAGVAVGVEETGVRLGCRSEEV